MLSPEKAPPLLPEPLQKMADICPSPQGALEVLEQEDAAFLFYITIFTSFLRLFCNYSTMFCSLPCIP